MPVQWFKFSTVLLVLCSMLGAAAATPLQEMLKSGDQAFREKKYDAALDLYRQALDHSPNGWNDNNCMYKIASVYRAQEKYQEAIEWYTLIRDLPDLNDQARANTFDVIGDVYYYSLKDYPKAEAAYLQALQDSPDPRRRSWMYIKLGYLFYTMKKTPEAIAALQKAAELPEPYYGSVIAAHRQLAVIYYNSRQYQQAIDQLKDLDFQKFPVHERRTAGYYAGLAAFQLRNYPLALQYFQLIPEDFNWTHSPKLLFIGRCLLAQKKRAEARQVLTKLRDHRRLARNERLEAGLLIGDSWRDERKYAEAEKAYRVALKLPGTNASRRQLLNRRIADTIEARKPKELAGPPEFVGPRLPPVIPEFVGPPEFTGPQPEP